MYISVSILEVYRCLWFVPCIQYTWKSRQLLNTYYIDAILYTPVLSGSNHHFSSGLMLHWGSAPLFRLGRGLPHIFQVTGSPAFYGLFHVEKLGWDLKTKTHSRLPPEALLMDRSKACVQHKGKRIIQFTPRAPAQNSVELCWAPHSFLLAGDGVDRLRQRPNIATRQENANPASWNDIFADSSHFVLSFSFAC